jgi:hypothetical protein
VYLCTLPKKQANLTAYKLQEIFGIIEYLKIFHTDKGKEVTARVVLEFLPDLNLTFSGYMVCPATHLIKALLKILNSLSRGLW